MPIYSQILFNTVFFYYKNVSDSKNEIHVLYSVKISSIFDLFMQILNNQFKVYIFLRLKEKKDRNNKYVNIIKSRINNRNKEGSK